MNSQTPSNQNELHQSFSSLNEGSNFSNATLKFISDMLMEEDDLDNAPYMLNDSLALLATQRSFQAVLHNDVDSENPHECLEGESAERDMKYLNDNNIYAENGDEYEYDRVLLASGRTQPLMQTYNEHSKAGRPKKAAAAATTVTREFVDLRSLLMTCAQAVSNLDTKSATHLLQQIRKHSSPQGGSLQRVAHYLANALEARLSGAGTPLYAELDSKMGSASKVLKAYKMCLIFFPTKKVSMLVANKAIEKLATGATALHIVDFGILYGFQWPRLIQILAERRGGPPKLRITGIEFPQKGDSPTESLEVTGRRLAKYCERFGVPFEYNAICQNWETIRVEDLKIRKDELLVVNSMFRFHNLLDEIVPVNNPRDAVLKLIKKSNPAMFIHGVLNGQFNAPFFTTRFSEAMYHFSNIFDMVEAMIPPEDEDRMIFENLLGKGLMNIVACEGTERVERPETYKNWQVRMRKAGLRQLPLDQEVVRHVRSTARTEYHKDLYVDEDGKWLLLGWKGRVNKAVSCWKPSEN